MLEDAQVPVVLTQERLREALPEHGAQMICLDTCREVIARESEEKPGQRGDGREFGLCYLHLGLYGHA